MTARNLLLVGASALALSVGLGLPARADLITQNLSAGNSAISGYPAPYDTVSISRTSSTTATITFTADHTGSYIYLMGDDGSGAAAVNVNSTNFSVSNITASNSGTGFTPGPFTQSSGSMDGFGNFNLSIDDFDGYTHSASTISFNLTDIGGTWASASDVLAANAGGYDAATHVFVTDYPADASAMARSTGFAGNGTTPPPPVPEPGSLGLLGTALVAFGWFRSRKNKKDLAGPAMA